MKTYQLSRLLAGTVLGGALGFATPALAQTTTATPPECPPGTVPGTAGACNPADTSQGTGTQPETTAPVEGTTTVPSTSASGAPVKTAQDIVITGTRIPQPNLTSASPVTVLSSQEVKLQGTSRTEDLINSLPQSFAAQGSNLSNGSSGTAQVNLRNLGSARTMVLINGRRLMEGDTTLGNNTPDINFIPTQLIKRVDVLTGGASSVYGADAVGGVVNFIMDNTFTGVRIDAQASVFQHDNRDNGDILRANQAIGFRPPHGLSTNGGAGDIAAVLGAAFDDGRGHVQAYATYRRQRPVLQSTRDYAFCGLEGNEAKDVAANGLYYCGGSATTSPTLIYLTRTGGVFSAGPNHTLTPGYQPFNFNPYNYYQRPDERYTFGAFADYEISPGAKPYLEAMFMDDRSDAVIAPAGAFFGNIKTINCDNALLSPAQVAVICAPGNIIGNFRDPVTGNTVNIARAFIARRNVEGGGRDDDLQHTDYRIVGGVRGDFLKGISYDASYQYGRVLRQDTHLNDFSVTRLTNALDVIADPVTGQPVCRSVLVGTDTNCVPYDIFTTNGVTPAALNYLQVPGIQRGIAQEAIGHFDATIAGAEYGVKSPWAEDGIGINVGAEYRKEQLKQTPDIEWQTGDLAGNGGPTPPVDGQFDVRELFAETQIPIVEHNFIDLLQLSAGYRYSSYKVASNTFSTDTYKVALEFAPIRDIRFRGSYNRAVRAPNIIELFFPQSVGLAGTNDPCAPGAGGAAPAATLAQCQLSGVTAAEYGTALLRNPANQYNGLLGGNPDLQPEKADSWTAGVILQPRFIPGLALTADYFNIKVKNVIGAQAYGFVLGTCMGLPGFVQDTSQCAFIHRDEFGTLWATNNGFVVVTNQNFPGVGLSTKGWDFSGTYSRRFGGLGTLNASFIGTLQGQTATLGGAGTGQFNPDVYPILKWRHKARLGFTLPNGIGISGQWRHFSGATQGNSAIVEPAAQKIASQDYFDLAMTARITNKFSLRMGANNILDRAPPIVVGQTLAPVFGNGNTYPQIYDAVGRYMFAGVTVDF